VRTSKVVRVLLGVEHTVVESVAVRGCGAIAVSYVDPLSGRGELGEQATGDLHATLQVGTVLIRFSGRRRRDIGDRGWRGAG